MSRKNPLLKSITVALAAGLALGSASVAHAGCIITAKNNATRNIPLGTCLFMAEKRAINAIGLKPCQGRKLVHDPSWDDTIVKVGADQRASISLFMDPIMNKESMTTTFSKPGQLVLPPRFSGRASIVLCY